MYIYIYHIYIIYVLYIYTCMYNIYALYIYIYIIYIYIKPTQYFIEKTRLTPSLQPKQKKMIVNTWTITCVFVSFTG